MHRLRQLCAQFARGDWLVVAALTPVFLYADRLPLTLVLAATGVLLVVALVRWFGTGRPITRTPLDVPIACLLLMTPLGLYASADWATSLPRLAGVLFEVALFYTVVRWSADARTFPWVVSAWLLSAFVIGTLSLLSVDWVSVKLPFVNVLTSRLPHVLGGLGTYSERGLNPNVVGGTLTLFVAPLLSGLWMSWWARHHASARPHSIGAWLMPPLTRTAALMWLLTTALVLGLLVLTQSRSALFGAAISIALLMVMQQGRTARRAVMLGGAALLVVALALGPARVAGALLGNGSASNLSSLDFAARGEVWSRALYAIQDFPFTGIGLVQFEKIVRLLYPYFSISPESDVPHAHNTFLQMALDFGVPGLVAYAAMLAAAMLTVVRALRAEREPFRRALVLGLAAGLLASQIFGMTDAVLFGTRPAFVWWLTLGLLVGLAAQQSAARLRWRISLIECVLLWVAASLVAVAVVEDQAALGVIVAVMGGCAFGVGAFAHHQARGDSGQGLT
ncbi:MAG: O-antigen ligase family protein [Chloroflexi bacterium]|nr:O-antigen ligase family protein [Chloroflexota bacterium]